MTFDEATMIEPLGCVVAGQKRLGIKKGKTVLIIGSGVAGILHIQLAKAKGAKVIATDINSFKLTKASEFGADHVINAGGYSVEELKDINDNRLADIVIVCAAARQAVDNAFSSVDKSGKVLFFAVPETDMLIPSLRLWRDEITITFSYGAAPDDIRKAINLIDRKKVNVSKMITHRVPLSNIGEGFRLASRGENSLKVVVVPDEDI